MSESKNKLVRSVSAEELTAFLEELTSTPGVDGPMIQARAKEKFGVEIGHNSANHFRKEVFAKYVEKLRRRRSLAAVVTEHSDTGAGRTLADAASDELSQMVFEFLTENDLDLSKEEDMERAEQLSRIIKQARSEDRKMVRDLSERLEKVTAVVETSKGQGLSAEQVAAIEETLNFRRPS